MAEMVSTLKSVALCLCAEWCGTCRGYREGVFAEVSRQYSNISFLWMDIEEHAALCDQFELESFPAWLIIWDGRPQFFGTLLPHYEHIDRLLQQVMRGSGLSLELPSGLQSLVDYIDQPLCIE